jgi:c(7)-type cytochrome triheme protein
MRFAKTASGLLLILLIVSLFAACSSGGPGADYTVRGKSSVYEEVDTRVYINEPILTGLKEDGIHDLENDAINRLQEPAASMSNFPYDRRGGVNWVEAIDKGVINPRMSLKGDSEMNIMDMDIMFKDTGQMPWVRFPHLAHTRWLDCSNCHPKIFIPQKGGNPNIGMDAIIGGKYCGRCHDKVAFPLWTCERCHSVPHEGSPDPWWRKSDNPFPATEEQKSTIE